jgi:hypothetical protein
VAESAPGEHRGDPAVLLSGYERLREAVASGRPDGWRLGHGVLATRGMVAWMAAFTEVASSPQAAAGEPGFRPLPSTLTSLPCTGEIVAVLSEMALAHAA